MRKNFFAGGLALVTFLIALVVFGQPPSPTDSLTPSPSPTSTSTPILISTATPTPTPTAAEALPQIGPSFTWNWTDPNLLANSTLSTFSGLPTPPPTPTPTPTPGPSGTPMGVGGIKNLRSDISYNVKVTGSQLIFNYGTFRAIRGTFFQRDSAYFALRNTVDQVISTVKTQFYQVVVNRELIVVQEESVRLLDSPLK